jgi:hypothetical protein
MLLSARSSGVTSSRFTALATAALPTGHFPAAVELQTGLLEKKLCSNNLYPLLWATKT